MKFHVIRPQTLNPAQSPIRVVEQATGREVGWVNRYLDREYVRRVADTTLRTWAYNLLHFVRWWESLHHTGDVGEGDLTESTLLDYVKFQSSQQPAPSSSTINDRVAVADRALRNEFPDAPCQVARGFHHAFLQRRPLGLGRPRSSDEPVASEGAQTQPRPAVRGGGGTFLVQFPHGSGLGHRGLDASARTALRRSVGFE